MKKIWLNLCVFAMILVMSAGTCVTAFAYSEEEIVYITEQYLTSWITTDFQLYLDEGITDEAAIEQFTGWQNLKNNMGDVEEVSGYQIEEADGMVTVTQTLVCTNDTILFSVTFDETIADSMDAYSAVMEINAVSANASSGDEEASLSKAALNTIMSMAIVFVVLIFIALIIYMMRFIPVLLDKVTGKNKNSEENVVQKKESQFATTEVETASDFNNEEEIAAVITAAIMAYEAETGAAPGTFVVRSIRRRQK